MKRKSVAMLLGVAAAAAVWMAVPAAAEETVTIGIEMDIGEVSPFSKPGYAKPYTQYLTYERLCYDDGSGTSLDVLKPWLAKEWHQDENDDQTVIVTLYDNIYDREGNHFTASDAVWSLQQNIDVGYFEKMQFVSDLTVIDDYTFSYKCDTYKFDYINYPLTDMNMVCQKAYEESEDQMATRPVSTSAYYISDLVAGSSITFSKNENYWQTDEAAKSVYATNDTWDTIKMMVITDTAQMAIALETGEIDIAGSLSASEVNRFYQEDGETPIDGFEVVENYSVKCNSIFCNCLHGTPTGDNLKLRQAIFYALDRDALLQGVVQGKGITTNAYGNPTFYDYLDEWKEWNRYPYDPDLAKQLLEESGYDTSQPLKLMCSANVDWHTGIANIVQAYLAQIGITVELYEYDNALYYTYMTDPTLWDLCVDYKGGSNYVVNLFALTFNPKSYEHGSHNFIDPEEDPKFYELLDACTDQRTHNDETLSEFMTYTYDQAYCEGLFVADTFIGAKAGWEIPTNSARYLIAAACSPAA